MAVGNNSDINRKELITPIEPHNILEKIIDLPISEWSYLDDAVRHIGPMAQDFHAAFGVGKNETTISTIDADGVALAGIQALYEKTERESREIRLKMKASRETIAKLEAENTDLKKINRNILGQMKELRLLIEKIGEEKTSED